MELKHKIEELRAELNKFAMYSRLADQKLVELSQKLDQLLNEFHEIKETLNRQKEK
ncbi:aspartyl-phosphate phosphatase Spo0E family protein [Fontibacillus phaseoli]|uniref:aspartyl-phosphate phosphatase Spo0E family protein n=1 Tax=Fontibacillus phaseoli TaxID=1416533 RepID=UPI000DF37530|nr:aspartyl-phosphate phosphatase Spo0E family protein [Fontibacillus phaseoli]